VPTSDLTKKLFGCFGFGFGFGFGLLCCHTVSNPSAAGTHTSGAQ